MVRLPLRFEHIGLDSKHPASQNVMVHKLPALALLLFLTGLLPGCTVCQLARVVSLEEPKIYDTKKDREISLATYRSMADRAWNTTGSSCPRDCTTADYSWGFKEGFAEYVYAGGSGEAPVLPPRAYWQSDMRTAEGAMAVRSWFEGYRHGARVAREGGYRKTATITASASVRDCDACGQPNGCGRDGCMTCSPQEAYSSNQSLPTALETVALEAAVLESLKTRSRNSKPPAKAPPIPTLKLTQPNLEQAEIVTSKVPHLKADVPKITPQVTSQDIQLPSLAAPSLSTSTSSNEQQVQKSQPQKYPVVQTLFPIQR